MKINLIPIALLVLSTKVAAQTTSVFSNSGTMYVSPQTEIFTVLPFNNMDTAEMIMDGELYLLDSYTNDGDFMFSSKALNSKVFFVQSDLQLIEGKKPSLFKNVLFKNSGTTLESEIVIYGVSDYEAGVVDASTGVGSVTYVEGGTVGVVSDASFVDGMVGRVGNEKLVLPIGNKGKYRTAVFGDENNKNDEFVGQYFLTNPLILHPKQEERSAIIAIDNAEYWEVQKGKSNKDGNGLLLSLSWDESTTPSTILADGVDKLGIVRWDEVNNIWVSEGGIVDEATKLVTIPVEVNGSSIFTLAAIDKDFKGDDSVVIYNAVSANGDGMNDYFIIKNINLYPNNTVRVYNRWGAKVFEASNYDPNGDGSSNVFSGVAQGKGVLGGGKLPSGTYFYDVRYEKTTKNGSENIKKAGYLHLEND